HHDGDVSVVELASDGEGGGALDDAGGGSGAGDGLDAASMPDECGDGAHLDDVEAARRSVHDGNIQRGEVLVGAETEQFVDEGEDDGVVKARAVEILHHGDGVFAG